MPTAKLTKRTIDAIQPPTAKRQDFYWDTELCGLGLRVSRGGRKSFVVQTPVAGRASKRRETLGAFGVLTVEQARRRARTLLGIVAEGRDPWKEAEQALAAEQAVGSEDERRAMTLQRYLDEIYLPGAKERKKSWTNDAKCMRVVCGVLGGKPLVDLTTWDIEKMRRAWLKAAPRPANATINERLAILRALLNEARRNGFIDATPFDNRAIKALPLNNERTRFLDTEELGRFLAEVDKMHPADWMRRAILLLLNTGMRMREALNLGWDDVSADGSVISLPDAKAGKRIVRVPSSLAADIMTWRQSAAPGATLLFPQDNDPSKPRWQLGTRRWYKLLSDAGIADFRVHDLRHTAATYARANGADLSTLQRMLGHRTLAMTQRYAHVTDPEHVQAVESIASALEAARTA